MSRYLPVSDVSAPYPWSLDSGALFDSGAIFYSRVNKLVPEGCPGTGYIENLAAAAGYSFELGLPMLSATPTLCQVKIFGVAQSGQVVDVEARVKESGTVIFQGSSPNFPTVTAGEMSFAVPQISSPSGPSGWSVEILCSSDSSGSQFDIYAIEVDFAFGTGAAETLAWMMVDEEGDE